MIITEISTLERLEDHEIRSEYGSETLKYDIAAALVAARKMKDLTQVALANIAGVSQAYIAKLESGEANPTIGRIGSILAAIWLKAEINLVPLVSTFDTKITEQKNTVEEASTAISAKVHSEIEQWIQGQMQHIEQQINQHAQSGKIPMGNPILNMSYIKSTQPVIAETSMGLAKAIQPLVLAPESGISSSNTGAVDASIRLVA